MMLDNRFSDIIYLDYASSTPCDSKVIEAMLPYFNNIFASPSGNAHKLSLMADEAVEISRQRIAQSLGCTPDEIIFTSGSTESNNIAIQGIVNGLAKLNGNKIRKRHIVTSGIEHKSVLDICQFLKRKGFDIAFVHPEKNGIVTADKVYRSIREETCLVSIMWANNELGTINEIKKIGNLCRENNILFHSDATQWIGKMPTNLSKLKIDLLSLSSHKIYGPKGVGALYIRNSHPSIPIRPIVFGGGQERGLRSGTPNVPGIVGFGLASEINVRNINSEAKRLSSLRKELEERILGVLPQASLNGDPKKRLPNISSLSFELPLGSELLPGLKKVACSNGSACNARDLRPSHVLRSIGVKAQLAKNTLRISLGRYTSEEDIKISCDEIIAVVNRLSQRV